jgi:hypothetical protein
MASLSISRVAPQGRIPYLQRGKLPVLPAWVFRPGYSGPRLLRRRGFSGPGLCARAGAAGFFWAGSGRHPVGREQRGPASRGVVSGGNERIYGDGGSAGLSPRCGVESPAQRSARGAAPEEQAGRPRSEAGSTPVSAQGSEDAARSLGAAGCLTGCWRELPERATGSGT